MISMQLRQLIPNGIQKLNEAEKHNPLHRQRRKRGMLPLEVDGTNGLPNPKYYTYSRTINGGRRIYSLNPKYTNTPMPKKETSKYWDIVVN